MTAFTARIRACVLLALLPASTACTAGSTLWASVGYVDEPDGAYSQCVAMSWLSGSDRAWETSAMRIAERDVAGASRRAQYVLAIARRIEFGRLHVLGGLGMNREDDEVLSGHLQFMSGFGASFGRMELSLRHLSNAGTRGRNRGETWLSVSVRLSD